MILNTLGKSLLTGLVAFFSVVSIAIVGIIFITYGMGQGAFSGHPMIMPWITPIGILIGTSTLY